jgi:hypothetical protein
MRIQNSAAVTLRAAARTPGKRYRNSFRPARKFEAWRAVQTLHPPGDDSAAFIFNVFRTLCTTCKNRLLCFQQLAHSFAHSFAFPKWQSPCFQSTAHSLAKNTRVGGIPFMKNFKYLTIPPGRPRDSIRKKLCMPRDWLAFNLGHYAKTHKLAVRLIIVEGFHRAGT